MKIAILDPSLPASVLIYRLRRVQAVSEPEGEAEVALGADTRSRVAAFGTDGRNLVQDTDPVCR